MKAEVTINELRVGNFVYGVNEYQGTALPIYSLHGDNTLRLLVGNESIGCFRVGLIKPIEITDEWLKMFGANCIGAKGWNFISVNKADTSYIYFNPNGIGLAIDNGTTENAIEVEIKYVHQLQNLYFALTNTELTIKTK